MGDKIPKWRRLILNGNSMKFRMFFFSKHFCNSHSLCRVMVSSPQRVQIGTRQKRFIIFLDEKCNWEKVSDAFVYHFSFFFLSILFFYQT